MNTREQEDIADNAFMTMAMYSYGSVRISLQKHFVKETIETLCYCLIISKKINLKSYEKN